MEPYQACIIGLIIKLTLYNTQLLFIQKVKSGRAVGISVIQLKKIAR